MTPSLLWLALAAPLAADVTIPEPVDPELVVELVAAEPEIVTPTGIAVDDRRRVLVVESHTHFRPEGYDGPTADRIRAFEDADGDGRFESVTTVFEGTRHTMNLAVEADGSLLVATRDEVFRLRLGPDGRAADREPLARLATKGDYPHNGLSGFALDPDGTIHFGLGENLGEPYALVGRDGTRLEGGGEGGSVYRIRPDGSGLARVATGFWNPFHLARDPFGRLFAVDNDPDSRPPCRLIHVVAGGDYGYRFRNGRRGLHPLTAWDGDLPGMLPMAAGTGEAPSGLVVYESNGLPASYRGALLVTSWGDHRIDRFDLESAGASFRARRTPIVAGGEDFRPVGIAVAPDGSLFVSDWVDRSYNVHGRGRVWRIRSKTRPEDGGARPSEPSLAERVREARELARDEAGRRRLGRVLREPSDSSPRARAVALEALAASDPFDEDALRAALDDPAPEVRALAVRLAPRDRIDPARLATADQPAGVRAEALRRVDDPNGRDALLAALDEPDPFLRQAAVIGLDRALDDEALIELTRSPDPAHRLGALLALRGRDTPASRAALPTLLADPDPTVRLAAVQWVYESDLGEYRATLESTLTRGPLTDRLFRAYLATLARLDHGTSSFRDESPDRAFVARLALDEATPPALRRLALRTLRPDDPALTTGRLAALLDHPDPGLRLEALRRLAERPGPDVFPRLAAVARDESRPEEHRAEAIAGLAEASDEFRPLLFALADRSSAAIRRQAVRSLRGVALDDDRRRRLDAAGLGGLLDPGGSARESPSLAGDAAAVAEGDPSEGRRVFFHPRGPGCYRCHQVDGRGATIGPDLTNIGRGSEPSKLVESILDPSREIAPQFTPHRIARRDGTVATGLVLVEHGDGSLVCSDSEGRTFTVRGAEIEQVQPVATSIMPEGLDRAMTAEEFRDLVAFLRDPVAEPAPDASPAGREP